MSIFVVDNTENVFLVREEQDGGTIMSMKTRTASMGNKSYVKIL
jgi:hypothetical protein